MASRERLPTNVNGQTVKVSEAHIDFNANGITHLIETLREEIAPEIRTVRFSGSYVNVWGYGDHIYLGLNLRKAGVPSIPAIIGYPEITPILYLMNTNGKLQTLLTSNQINITAGTTVGEVVAVLEAPDGTIFCTTHPEPVTILKYMGGTWSRVYRNTEYRTSYGIAVDVKGYLYATIRGPNKGRAILRSIDRGDTWVSVWSDIEDWIFSIKCHGNTVVAGAQNLIVRSGNNGDAWTTSVIIGSVRGIEYAGYNVWLAFIQGTNTFYISIDDGVSWIKPANTLPIIVSGSAVPSAINTNGDLVLVDVSSGQLALSRNMGSKWLKGGIFYSGYNCRTIYTIGSYAYIGGETDYSYYGVANNGVVFIVPLTTNLAENYGPVILWANQSITDLVTGSTTLPIITQGITTKTFYIYSTQAGNLNILYYDEVNAAYRNVATTAILANTLTPYQTTNGARLMQINFIPTVAATVSAWAIF